MFYFEEIDRILSVTSNYGFTLDARQGARLVNTEIEPMS